MYARCWGKRGGKGKARGRGNGRRRSGGRRKDPEVTPDAVAMAAVTETATTGLVCGRCLKKPSAVEWPKLPGTDGVLKPTGYACMRCWRGFSRIVAPLGIAWDTWCGECKEDRC